MTTILVSGLINIETTLQVEAFPVVYTPVRYPFFGVNSTVSGVGYNVAKALTTLGDAVSMLALVGRRQINVDLKNSQEQAYPPNLFAAALDN